MTDLINLKKDASQVKEAPHQSAFTGVRIYVGKDNDNNDLYYSAGNSNGTVLELENPWATQAIANNILTAISGYSYRPMQADGALLDPAAELGDGISVNGVYSVLAKNDTTFGSLLVSDIAAPSDGELGHEYPYVSKQRRETQREIDKANSSLTIQLDEIKGQVTDDQGNYTVVTIKSDGLYVGGQSATLDGDNIKAGSIGTTQIAGGAITTSELAANAVTSAKIKAGAVDTNQLAANAVTASELAAEAVRTNNLLVTGMVNFYNSTSKTTYAQLGYGTGQDGSGSSTYGAKLVATGGSNYIIVTNAGARMTAGSGYIYTADNKCYCSSAFVAGSDERIKEDIDDDMSRYKDVLMHLRPVSFKYKPEWLVSDQRYTGFIAQEAEAAIDEAEAGDWAMTNINGEGIHGISYEQVIPVLVACIQDLSKEVAELKERLNG